MRRDGSAADAGPPTYGDDTHVERVARRRAARTRATLTRSRSRLTVAALAGALAHAAGGQALPVAGTFILGCALVSTLRSFATREPFLPPYLGHGDEAAWFLLLGFGVRAFHGG